MLKFRCLVFFLHEANTFLPAENILFFEKRIIFR